jgi:hypothetical protein
MITRESIILSVSRGLWGEVMPEMRAVACRRRGPDAFDIIFYVDGATTEALFDSVTCVGAEVVANFPDNAEIEEIIERVDAPARIPWVEDALVIYARKERETSLGADQGDAEGQSAKSWYSANLLLKAVHQDSVDADPLWEESIRIYQAESEDEARQLAEADGLATEDVYDTTAGLMRWKFQRVDRVVEIYERSLVAGTEVFSRFLTESEVVMLQTPFDD